MDLLQDEAPRAVEIQSSEYFDLWWESLINNPSRNSSAGLGLLILLAVVVAYLRKTSKQPKN